MCRIHVNDQTRAQSQPKPPHHHCNCTCHWCRATHRRSMTARSTKVNKKIEAINTSIKRDVYIYEYINNQLYVQGIRPPEAELQVFKSTFAFQASAGRYELNAVGTKAQNITAGISSLLKNPSPNVLWADFPRWGRGSSPSPMRCVHDTLTKLKSFETRP